MFGFCLRGIHAWFNAPRSQDIPEFTPFGSPGTEKLNEFGTFSHCLQLPQWRSLVEIAEVDLNPQTPCHAFPWYSYSFFNFHLSRDSVTQLHLTTNTFTVFGRCYTSNFSIRLGCNQLKFRCVTSSQRHMTPFILQFLWYLCLVTLFYSQWLRLCCAKWFVNNHVTVCVAVWCHNRKKGDGAHIMDPYVDISVCSSNFLIYKSQVLSLGLPDLTCDLPVLTRD